MLCPKPMRMPRRNIMSNTRYFESAKRKIEMLNVELFRGEEQIEIMKLIDSVNYNKAIEMLKEVLERTDETDKASKSMIEEICTELENIKKLGGMHGEI